MKEVKLRMKEQTKYDVIKELVDHKGNKKRVALKLNISIRQVNRLITKYNENGKSSFIQALLLLKQNQDLIVKIEANKLLSGSIIS